MNVNDLADRLEQFYTGTHIDKAAETLRQQAQEIEVLKKELEQIKIWCGKTQFVHDYSSPFIELQKASERA